MKQKEQRNPSLNHQQSLLILAGPIVFGLAFPCFGQQIYKWQDEKGQWHFSDQGPSSVVVTPNHEMRSKDAQASASTAPKASKGPDATMIIGRITPDADGGQFKALLNLRKATLRVRFLTDDVKKLGITESDFKRVAVASFRTHLPKITLDERSTQVIDIWLSCDSVKLKNFDYACGIHLTSKSVNPGFIFGWDRSISVFGESKVKPLEAGRQALDRLLERFAEDWRRANR